MRSALLFGIGSLIAAIAALAACAEFGSSDDGAVPAVTDEAGETAAPSDGGAGDGAVAPTGDAACDPSKPFGALALVAGASSVDDERGAVLFGHDELFFSRGRQFAAYGIFHSQAGANEQQIALPGSVAKHPALSADGLTLFFESNLTGSPRIAVARRANPQLLVFGAPFTLPGPEGFNAESMPYATKAGALWLTSVQYTPKFQFDLFVSGPLADGGLAAPVGVAELNTTASELAPVLSEDELRIYFASDRPAVGTRGRLDVWTASRATRDDAWSDIKLVEELNTTDTEVPTWLSPDGCRLLVMSDRRSGPESNDVYLATKPPR